MPELFNRKCETGHHGSKLAEWPLLYSVTLTHKYDLPVRSAVFLLRKEADSPALNGVYERRYADGSVYLRFEYRVVHVWRLPVEELLTGGVATLPLAPIADVPESELPRVIARIRERIGAEPKETQQELWVSTYFLMGAKYPSQVTNRLLKGIGIMFESSTYTEAVEKERAQGISQGITQGELRGRLREGRELIVTLGRERLGEPSPEVTAQRESIPSREQFPALIKRVSVAKSWNDLFAL